MHLTPTGRHDPTDFASLRTGDHLRIAASGEIETIATNGSV